MRRDYVVALVLLVAGACGQAPDGAIEPPGPDPVAEGAELYAASCALCHGTDLRGTDRGPSLLSAVYEPGHHSDGAFLVAVERGSPAHHWDFGPMPPIQGLDHGEIQAIVDFVRETQRVEGLEPYPP